MFKTGVASISFRNNTAAEIITAASNAGLMAIEWGSDIHAPAHNIKALKEIKKLSAEYNIGISSYGSYYRLGKDSADDIKPYLEAASILGTDTIRIWCGEKGSAEISKTEFAALADDGKKIAETARIYGIKLCLECHGWTLTDDFGTSLKYINEVGFENFKMYWQPNQFKSFEYNIESAKALCDITENIHVFNWDSENRYPLHLAESEWLEYLKIFKDGEHYALLEFMHDDNLSTLKETADTLKKICSKL